MNPLQSRKGWSTMNLRLLLHAALFAFVALAALARADEKILYEKPSLFGAIVVTEEENGLRNLRFGREGARQRVTPVVS